MRVVIKIMTHHHTVAHGLAVFWPPCVYECFPWLADGCFDAGYLCSAVLSLMGIPDESACKTETKFLAFSDLLKYWILFCIHAYYSCIFCSLRCLKQSIWEFTNFPDVILFSQMMHIWSCCLTRVFSMLLHCFHFSSTLSSGAKVFVVSILIENISTLI